MTLGQIASALSIIGAVAGGAFFMDDRHAHNDEVQKEFTQFAGNFDKLTKTIDRVADENRLYGYRQRLWYLQKEFGQDCGKAKQECQWLQIEIDKLVQKLNH